MRTYMSYLCIILGLVASCGCGKTLTIGVGDTASCPPVSSEFDSIICSLDTPEKLEEWMRANIVYREDEYFESDFTDVRTTYMRGYGDCDDYAMFASYVLEQHGHETWIISIYGENGYGHAICIFENGYFTNSELRYDDTAHITELIGQVCPNWTGYSVYPDNTLIRRIK